MSVFRPICGTTAALLLFSLAGASAAAEPRERWQITTTLSMPGMALPPSVLSVCQDAKQREQPPVPDENCQVQDIRRSGNTLRWQMVCEEGSGEGEITFQGRDAYSGTFNLTSADGQRMGGRIAGKRVGTCAAGEAAATAVNPTGTVMPEQTRAAVQAYTSVAMTQACGQAVVQMQPALLMQAGAGCQPEHVAAFCNKLRTREGLAAVAARPREPGVPGADDLTDAGKLCGTDAVAAAAAAGVLPTAAASAAAAASAPASAAAKPAKPSVRSRLEELFNRGRDAVRSVTQ